MLLVIFFLFLYVVCSSKEVTNSIGMEMRLISKGKFMMGSPEDEEKRYHDETLHQVEITKPFYIGVYEVKRGEWKAIMGTTPWSDHDSFVSEDYPVSFVSWEDAQEFRRRLSEKEGKTYRLPTEAEWEYACRAGSTTAYCYGDDASDLDEYAWYEENARNSSLGYFYEVGHKQPNKWGLYDMHGNVGEQCQDWYDGDYEAADVVDPIGPPTGDKFVTRGGDWFSDAKYSRSAARRSYEVGAFAGHNIGFRVVCEAE